MTSAALVCLIAGVLLLLTGGATFRSGLRDAGVVLLVIAVVLGVFGDLEQPTSHSTARTQPSQQNR